MGGLRFGGLHLGGLRFGGLRFPGLCFRGLWSAFSRSVFLRHLENHSRTRRSHRIPQGLQLKNVSQSLHPCMPCRDITRLYRLNVAAAKLRKCLKTDHVNAVNAAIENGEVSQKSKGIDPLTSVAVALNAINYFITSLLN